MAFGIAYVALVNEDWNIVSEMLDKGELSVADINQHHGVRSVLVKIPSASVTLAVLSASNSS